MKDKMVYKWNNVVGALMNVPISVGTFSVVTDFAVLENMKDYRDKGMDDVIFGEPCLVGVVLLVKDCRMINHRTMKYPKVIAENALVGIGKFVFPIDFIILDVPEDVKGLHVKLKRKNGIDLEARLMEETLVLNRSLDPFFEDYIELNDLNVPLELRRDQVDDLMPTIEEGEVVEEFRARNDARMVSKFFGYPSDCDHDKKIRIDCAHNLKFSCMIDFVVLEDMDAYRDEGMGDVIFGEPFLREVRINARRFEGMITIHNGNEEVTYQMVRSHPRFKHRTNKQCNKISPLLKDLAAKKSTKLVKYLKYGKSGSLVLLVQSYNCLFRVSAAGTKLQLLKDYNCSRIKTAEKIKIDWRSRILIHDYTLWEIVENGNAPIVTKTVDGKETVIPPTSVEEKAQRRAELKARSTFFPPQQQITLPTKDPCYHLPSPLSIRLNKTLCTGSEHRPPMHNKEKYGHGHHVILRYAKSRPNGKLIYNSIMNGPYVRRMIPEPGDADREMEADDQACQTILLGLPEDIYAAVDSCETAQEIWLRVQQMMKGSDIGIQEKKAKLFNEWERFTSTDGESIESTSPFSSNDE
ncbi:hypothetical protein Tco_0097432 [Tanacetum coccineum]